MTSLFQTDRTLIPDCIIAPRKRTRRTTIDRSGDLFTRGTVHRDPWFYPRIEDGREISCAMTGMNAEFRIPMHSDLTVGVCLVERNHHILTSNVCFEW